MTPTRHVNLMDTPPVYLIDDVIACVFSLLDPTRIPARISCRTQSVWTPCGDGSRGAKGDPTYRAGLNLTELHTYTLTTVEQPPQMEAGERIVRMRPD
jgi:hypothetical protein